MSTATADTSFLDYITDAAFRASLVADHRELLAARDTGCWKAVHVLAGSMVEAILIDYLLQKDPSREQAILKLSLDDAIGECRTAGILSERNAQLCTVIKGYRNLIHPGRVKRQAEEVSEDGATVATALVRMVASDVARKQKETYGYTADEVMTKIQTDSAVFATVAPTILKKLHSRERERLLFELLPEAASRMWTEVTSGWEDTGQLQKIPNLRLCYSLLWDLGGESTRKRLVKQYLEVLHREAEAYRTSYENTFLIPGWFEQMEPDERAAVIAHLLAALAAGARDELFEATRGFTRWLTPSDCSGVNADNFLNIYLANLWKDEDFLVAWFFQAIHDMPKDVQSKMGDYITDRMYSARKANPNSRTAKKLAQLVDEHPLLLPF